MEELSEDTILARDAVQGLLKAKKLLKMYPDNNPIYIKASEESYNKFKSFFELNNELLLKIRQHEIIFNTNQIYHNPQKDDNLALFFFKDGIKELTFLNGLGMNEFENFIKILNTDFENEAFDDDIVTLLWEQDFEHIKYIVDEEVLSDEEEDEKNRLYEKAKDQLYSDDDLLRAYHDGLKTTEKEKSNLVPVDEEELKNIVIETEKEDTLARVDKVIIILFELLYQTREKLFFSEIVGFLENTMGYCIKNGNFKRTLFIINSIRSVIKEKSIDEENIRTLKKIFTSISSKPFILEICNVIDSESVIDEDELVDFVKNLDRTSISTFMNQLGELQSIKGRRLLINVLSVIGRLDMESISKGLYDSRWYVVRNIIAILGKIADARAVEYLTKTLSHPDQRVRKETIKTMGSIGGTVILPHLKKALTDSDPSVRIPVVRILGNSKTEGAKKILLSELLSKDFASKDFIEKKEFFEAITHWQDQEVNDFLFTTLKKKKIWKKTKNDETRACAAYAIGIIGDKEAIPLLEQAQNSKNKLLKTFSSTAIKQLTTEDVIKR